MSETPLTILRCGQLCNGRGRLQLTISTAVLHVLATQEVCYYVVVANNFMKRVKHHQIL